MRDGQGEGDREKGAGRKEKGVGERRKRWEKGEKGREKGVDGFRWALRFPIPLSICPSIIYIKEGRTGGSLLLSPTPLLLFLTRKK
jgi:hypothetical protein